MQLTEASLVAKTNSCALVKELFKAELRRLDGLLEEIALANDRIKGIPFTAGFLFNGEFYKRNTARNTPGRGEKVDLDYSLTDQMLSFCKETALLLNDIQMINQMVFRLVKGCETNQDVRDALPECLAGFSEAMRALPRTREAGYTLEGDERAQRQYAKILPRMEFYSVMGLIY
ncbi:hypothetical protein Axy10_046 [Achromobacter phage vB_AxyP_19-32_Axy10]|uniref:Uncharacterized protein n=1 Tax=Achromobacter phage vB_AxyP_19-32_Axy10 TaxID=2591041 RepID=A0A514CTZ4_9CAUD|nr:hypothetical protein KMC59_gp72 [Achromobacter phage vB_AxyP_19-32_Axy10]QDH83947.1 hypothetical protein Axy10_046 [Achromobacter phage vB_AxyP_19-32_Axy10]